MSLPSLGKKLSGTYRRHLLRQQVREQIGAVRLMKQTSGNAVVQLPNRRNFQHPDCCSPLAIGDGEGEFATDVLAGRFGRRQSDVSCVSGSLARYD